MSVSGGEGGGETGETRGLGEDAGGEDGGEIRTVGGGGGGGGKGVNGWRGSDGKSQGAGLKEMAAYCMIGAFNS